MPSDGGGEASVSPTTSLSRLLGLVADVLHYVPNEHGRQEAVRVNMWVGSKRL